MSYTILDGGRAILCDLCMNTSWNPDDVANLYCGHCKQYHQPERGFSRLLYTLDENHQAVPCADCLEWARSLEHFAHMASDEFNTCRVSTVFLGFDHSFGFGPPQLFETAVFTQHGLLAIAARYTTWDEALAGHARIRALCAAADGAGRVPTRAMLREAD